MIKNKKYTAASYKIENDGDTAIVVIASDSKKVLEKFHAIFSEGVAPLKVPFMMYRIKKDDPTDAACIPLRSFCRNDHVVVELSCDKDEFPACRLLRRYKKCKLEKFIKIIVDK